MRIPFPERVPIDRVAVFAVLLFIVQSLEGTPLYFAAGCAAFLVLSALAFNTGGGLSRAAGTYVFFYAMLVVIVGIVYKAFLGERADSNLTDPQGTIAVYVAGMVGMLASVSVSRRFARKTGLLQNMMKEADMYRACIGCIAFGIVGPMLIGLLGSAGAKLNSAFTQLNNLPALAIIIAVLYEIRRSGGTRSLNLPALGAMLYSFVIYGVLGFSKQGMLEPLYCWVVPVCAMRYRLTMLQVVSCMVGLFIVFQYLVPYSQYGRRYLTPGVTTSGRIAIAVPLIFHLEDTREKYEAIAEGGYVGAHYYNTAQGFWDRLNFIAVDDSLINITDQGAVFGYLPIIGTFTNAIPRVFYPNKPTYNFGNSYAHEMGGLADDDITTGISFSPTAEVYHIGTWVGLLVVAPIIWLMFFVAFDSLLGDLRTTPWGLLAIAIISHAAPETGITGVIYVLTYGSAILIFCAFFAAKVSPVIATAVVGKDRQGWRHKAVPPLSSAVSRTTT